MLTNIVFVVLCILCTLTTNVDAAVHHTITLGAGPLSASNHRLQSTETREALSRIASLKASAVEFVVSIYVDNHDAPNNVYAINDHIPLQTPNSSEVVFAAHHAKSLGIILVAKLNRFFNL
jgi:hypothetical protein